jgi:uncharacterized surface protein with fasciclin (FAS1) repeats
MRLRTLLPALLLVPLAASAQHQDIVELASSNDDLETLVAAVQAAGLVETLQGDGPFTVFAPTDAAFGRLGEDTLRDLLRPENRDQLTAILTYHVVPGRFTAAQIGRLDELETVGGQSVSLGVRVDDAALVATDVRASNGIVHVIDRVLMPREMPSRRSSSHH